MVGTVDKERKVQVSSPTETPQGSTRRILTYRALSVHCHVSVISNPYGAVIVGFGSERERERERAKGKKQGVRSVC